MWRVLLRNQLPISPMTPARCGTRSNDPTMGDRFSVDVQHGLAADAALQQRVQRGRRLAPGTF